MIFSQEFNKSWSVGEKLLMRTLFTYLALYILLMFFSFLLETPIRWFAQGILGMEDHFSMDSTGSGDRTFDYVRLTLNLVLTFPIVIVWSLVDQKRNSYNQLSYWFQAILRTSLFFAMLIYGLAKVFKGQFADISLLRLLQPVGELSPMGLAWTFMGHSFFYNLFIGFSELLGGVLVLFRKTMTLGALIICGVMGNVFMMNMTYDIPVKLFSAHLLFLAFILVWVDRRRLLSVFFKNETVSSVAYYVFPINQRLKRISVGVRRVLIALIMLTVVVQVVLQYDITDQLREKSELYGIWEIEVFIDQDDTIPPLITSAERWHYLVIDQKRRASVKMMNGAIDRFDMKASETGQSLYLTNGSSTDQVVLFYDWGDEHQLLMEGLNGRDSLHLTLKKVPLEYFELLGRGFNWVNEYPYNR